MSLKDTEESALIAQVQEGRREAFDTLYASYEKQIHGFIRAQAHDDGVTRQIAQNTQEKVWEKMPTYDPGRKGFRAFAKYWASIMLLRYYDEQQRRSKLEVLFSQLHARYPELEHEPEIGDVLARFAAYKSPSVEDEKIVDEEAAEILTEVYEGLLQLTFGGTSPPHQLIAFGFRNLVVYSTSEQEWKPSQIVAELSDVDLTKLVEQLEHAYAQTSHLPEDRISCHFERLHQSMLCTVGTVMTELRTRETHAALLDHIVGPTTLRQYYTHPDKPTADISHWCEAVQKRVWSRRRWKSGVIVEKC